ncbi:Armadillo-type fold [Phytophthora cactorum]|nr:Armadillo-type fold [Phytophthora cactorum]
MDLALLVVEGLRQIYKLQDAIRRQRRVNRTTYLRMMEIYVELEMSEPLQGNPTLVRTDAIKKFSDAVATFSWYLQKHNDMHRVVRIFKFATMEKQRQKIVDEINEIFQMLNLATSVAVMNGQAAASTNAARLMTKLEAMHGDIRLSHDEIHAALVEEKQQLQIPKMKMLREGGPTLEDVTADEVAKGEVLVRQAPLRKTDGPPPVDDCGYDGGDSNSTRCTRSNVRGEKSVRAEKTTPLAATVELEQHSGEDSIIEKPILNGVKQDTVIDEPEEELEPREEYTADEVEQSASDKTTEEKDGANQTAPFQQSNTSVPLLIQRLSSDQATEQEQEQTLLDLLRKCVTNTNRVQIYKTKGIPVLTDLVRNSESFFAQLYALHCLSWFTFSYSKMRESEFEILQKCVREPTHLEILTLLHQLQYGDENVKEIAVLQSSCMATRADGDALLRVGVLTPVIGLLKDGTANHKLWAAEMLATLASDDDANGVAIARGGAIPPLVSLLRSGTDMQKQEAAYALGNLAANNKENRGKIAREGAIPPMVAFVKAVTDAQSQWAVYALGSLSVENEENRVLIAQEGAILLSLPCYEREHVLRSNHAKWCHRTADRASSFRNCNAQAAGGIRFGNLACDNDTVSDFDEAILPLVELVRTGSDTQQEDAAYTLGNLASNNDERRVEIGRIGAIPPLVKLLHTGTGSQKQGAAFALRCLACNNDSNRAAIVEEGAIAPLASLIDEGTEEQIEEAANALKHLVAKNDAIAQAFIPTVS